MSRDDHQIRVRIPSDIMQTLKTRAFINRRSLNSEIIYGIEQYISMDEATKKASGQLPGTPDASEQ